MLSRKGGGRRERSVEETEPACALLLGPSNIENRRPQGETVLAARRFPKGKFEGGGRNLSRRRGVGQSRGEAG